MLRILGYLPSWAAERKKKIYGCTEVLYLPIWAGTPQDLPVLTHILPARIRWAIINIEPWSLDSYSITTNYLCHLDVRQSSAVKSMLIRAALSGNYLQVSACCFWTSLT